MVINVCARNEVEFGVVDDELLVYNTVVLQQVTLSEVAEASMVWLVDEPGEDVWLVDEYEESAWPVEESEELIGLVDESEEVV